MAINYVELILDLYDGQGNPVYPGTASLVPSAQLTDTTDNQVIGQAPVVVTFQSTGVPTVKLAATDNGTLTPSGWAWGITFTGVPGTPAPFSFFLPYTGGSTQYLSSLVPTFSPATMAAYLPLPTGTATSGQVPVATGSGEASAWGNVATNPMTTSGDTVYGGTGGALTRLAGDTSNTRKFLREQSSSGTAQPPAWDTLQSGDVPTLNQNTTGTAAGLSSTLAIGSGGTGQTTAAAALTALAGTQTSGRVLRSDGVNTTLAAIQVGDVPTLNQNSSGTAANVTGTVAIANGGSGQATQAAAIDALTGTQSAGKVLRSDGTHATLASLQAGDVPTLNQNTTGTASNITGTLDAVPAPAAAVSLNSKKITNLANGSAAQDAAAFGQTAAGGNTTTIAHGGTGQTAAAAGFNALNPNAVPASFAPANPSTTVSTSLVMMGLGTTYAYTPKGSGKVLVVMLAYVGTNTATVTFGVGLRYGTGTAPANGAAVTGTQFGPADSGNNIKAGGTNLQSLVGGTAVLSLTPSTAYWFDFAINTSNASDAAVLVQPSASFIELPAGS